MSSLPACGCKTPPGPLNTQLPSLYILSKVCPTPSVEDFAKFPKVAVPCSVRTEALLVANSKCATIPDPVNRFSKYQRFQAPTPCQALPQSANMAGISQPSSRKCNL